MLLKSCSRIAIYCQHDELADRRYVRDVAFFSHCAIERPGNLMRLGGQKLKQGRVLDYACLNNPLQYCSNMEFGIGAGPTAAR
jgi:hypothetical protein